MISTEIQMLIIEIIWLGKLCKGWYQRQLLNLHTLPWQVYVIWLSGIHSLQNSNAEATSVQTFAPKVSHTEILGSLGVYCVLCRVLHQDWGLHGLAKGQ